MTDSQTGTVTVLVFLRFSLSVAVSLYIPDISVIFNCCWQPLLPSIVDCAEGSRPCWQISWSSVGTERPGHCCACSCAWWSAGGPSVPCHTLHSERSVRPCGTVWCGASGFVDSCNLCGRSGTTIFSFSRHSEPCETETILTLPLADPMVATGQNLESEWDEAGCYRILSLK